MNLKFTDVPNGLKALVLLSFLESHCSYSAARRRRGCIWQALSVVPKEGWAQMVVFAGFLELVVNKKTSEPGW